VLVIAALIIAASVIAIYASSFLLNPQTSSVDSSTATLSTQTQFTSDINSSLVCSLNLNLQAMSGFNNLTSNIEAFPKFITLQGNRTGYVFAGGGCANETNGTQISADL
jgi:hypothetical protein